MKAMSIGRLAPWLVSIGVVTQLVGLAVDGVLHSRVESVASESLVSLNPGHIGLGVGMALTAAGAALGIASRQAQRGASALLTYGPPVGLVVLGLVAGAFATQARGHRDDRHSEGGGAATIAAAGQQPADHHANGSESAAVSAATNGDHNPTREPSQISAATRARRAAVDSLEYTGELATWRKSSPSARNTRGTPT